VSLLDFTTPTFDVLEEVGVVQLPRIGTAIRVRVMDTERGPAVDVREWWTDDRWTKIRDARARAAATGRRWRGPTGELYTGPLRRGWWLQPHTADELAELLALAVVKAEAV